MWSGTLWASRRRTATLCVAEGPRPHSAQDLLARGGQLQAASRSANDIDFDHRRLPLPFVAAEALVTSTPFLLYRRTSISNTCFKQLTELRPAFVLIVSGVCQIGNRSHVLFCLRLGSCYSCSA